MLDESEVKVELLKIAGRIVETNHPYKDEAAAFLKEIYRQIVALYNEKL